MSQRLPPLKSQFQMHESQMTDVPGPFADLDRKNDAFQNHLEHNATLPFDNDTQRHTWLLSHDDISLPPPPSSLNHNATTIGAAAYFPSAAGCTSSSGGAEIPWQDSKSYMQQTHLGPGIMFGRREYWGTVKDAAHPAGAPGPCLGCNVEVIYLPL